MRRFLPAALQLPLAPTTIRNAAQQSVTHDTSLKLHASFTVPAVFPSTIFSSYYREAQPTRQPQPAIFDSVLNITFPLNLTDPETLPAKDEDPPVYPEPIGEISDDKANSFFHEIVSQISAIREGDVLQNACQKCVATLNALKALAIVVPRKVPDALMLMCQYSNVLSSAQCEENFQRSTFASAVTQAFAYANIFGGDGKAMCFAFGEFCPRPLAYPPLNTMNLFPKQKPKDIEPPKPSAKRVKVVHLSDFHLDPRYSTGSEADCDRWFCCRKNSVTRKGKGENVSLPAPLWGAFNCDTPYFLAAGIMQAIGPLTGTDKADSSLAFTIFTGDLVSHDPMNELSRNYVEYEETSVYSILHSFLKGPVFAALGNHDTHPAHQDPPHSLPDSRGDQRSWNFEHLSRLWEKHGWLSGETTRKARLHYGAYSVMTDLGLRVISINTDFWYIANAFNLIDTSNPDVSGMLSWLITELQAAEDNSERVWIIGHVLPGWDGSQAMPKPSDLFYQIVDRYSPHVIVNTFWGHTHQDHLMIFYSKNGTTRNDAGLGARDALVPGWIGPSVTPLPNLNTAFRVYEIDTSSFEVFESLTYYADVSTFPELDHADRGPVFQLGYSAREEYGRPISWPEDAPLNATFWHRVTQEMEREAEGGSGSRLAQRFHELQASMSAKTTSRCDSSECAVAKVCYIRSGSTPLGMHCPKGFGLV